MKWANVIKELEVRGLIAHRMLQFYLCMDVETDASFATLNVMKARDILAAAATLLPFTVISGCARPDTFTLRPDTFTLYRSSVLLENARVHVASFDAADGEKYNNENCQQAQELYQGQPGVKVRFWCEKGRFTSERGSGLPCRHVLGRSGSQPPLRHSFVSQWQTCPPAPQLRVS
jgi:hypothetical protein